MDELVAKVWNYKGCCEKREIFKQQHKQKLSEFDRLLWSFENHPALWDIYSNKKTDDNGVETWKAEMDACHDRMGVHIRIWGGEYKMYGGEEE